MLPSPRDIIYAPASPLAAVDPSTPQTRPGPSRALIRLSGPGVFDLVERFLYIDEPPAARAPVRTRGVHRIRLRLTPTDAERTFLPAAVVDRGLPLPCLLLSFPAPRSFTGQDSAELVLSANPLVVERVLGQIADTLPNGHVRPAEPGEFAARAFLNGRLSLAQAEGIAALIRAADDHQIAGARRVMSGQAARDHQAIADDLANLLALVEAGIDFTDQEDVVPIPAPALRARLTRLRDSIAAFLPPRRSSPGTRSDAAAPSTHKQAADHLPVVVLVGRPNAGKSALFNALLGKPRSIVAPVAGTTRDVIREQLPLTDPSQALISAEPIRCTLCDLAGLDEALAPSAQANPISTPNPNPYSDPNLEIDRLARAAALRALASADVLIWCDPTGRFRDAELASWLTDADRQAASDHPARDPSARPRAQSPTILRIRTKADLPLPTPLPPGETQVSADTVPPTRTPVPLAVSAIDGRNIAPLKHAIADALGHTNLPGSAATVAVVARHARALAAAMSEIDAALNLLPPDPSDSPTHAPLPVPELIAGHLRAALDRLAELTGAIPPDEVIGRVFATFCVGK
ncbi:MAG: 50S ribosome-binding GTPase [Phycisphaeraceae bacterium]|nr:50S ribosome-binding GTPase [Phycisphaeraceae bacterium]